MQMLTTIPTNTKQTGFIAFITILILGAVVLLVTISVGLQGVSGLKNAQAFTTGTALRIANTGCIDNALLRLRYSAAYAGETIVDGDTQCTITVTDLGSNQLSVRSTAISTSPPLYQHVILVTVRRLGSSLGLEDWQESII